MESFLYRYAKSRPRYYCAVLYPNRYEIGMSNLGFQTLYHQAQLNEDWMCERFFDDGGEVVSYETARPLNHFHVILVSVSFEPDVVHLAQMFKRAGLGLRKDRQENWPLVIIGGIGVSLMARTLSFFVDVLVTLRAEIFMPYLRHALSEARNKLEALDLLKECDGVTLSKSLTEDRLPWKKADFDGQPSHTVILSDKAEFANRGLIELSESCRYNCAFCLVSNVYGDYTARDTEAIFETAERYRGLTRRLGLVAATLTNHPHFRQIIETLNQRDFELSFSAFRIEALDDDLLEKVVLNENRTLVVAPETASLRMKRLIHKNISNEVFLKKIAKACEIGIKRIKMYFIVGFPGETEEDIRENIALVTEVRRVSQLQSKKYGYIPEIIVDINPLVPKPFTDLADVPMESVKVLKNKILMMKKGVRNLGRVFVYGESPRRAHLQFRLTRQEIVPEELWKMKI